MGAADLGVGALLAVVGAEAREAVLVGGRRLPGELGVSSIEASCCATPAVFEETRYRRWDSKTAPWLSSRLLTYVS